MQHLAANAPVRAEDRSPVDDFPIPYGLILDAPSMTTGEYQDGMTLLFNTLDKPREGDLCAVHLKEGGVWMMYLRSSVEGWIDRLPLEEHPGSDVAHGAFMQVLGRSTKGFLRADSIAAIHKCDGVYAADVRAEASHA